MNINNLYKGQIIKNYKELCSLIDEKPKTSNSKEAQLKELKRFINYHNEGHKFIIDEVYESPKAKEDKRINGLYIDDLKAMIMNLSANTDNYKLLMSSGRLFKATNMTNDNYIEGRKHIDKLSELTEVSTDICYEFYNYTQSSLKSKIESALNSLQKELLIKYERVYIVVTKEVILDDLKPFIKRVHRRATEEELAYILNVEQETIEKLGVKTIQQVFLTGQWKLFKKKVNSILQDDLNIEYYYEGYSIVYNPEYTRNYIEKNNLKDIIRERLNDNICLMLKNYANGKNNKGQQESVFVLFGGQDISDKDKKYYDGSYLMGIDVLIDTVIDDKARDIREELKKGINPRNIIENDEIPF